MQKGSEKREKQRGRMAKNTRTKIGENEEERQVFECANIARQNIVLRHSHIMKTTNSVGMSDNCFGSFVLFQVQNKNMFVKIKIIKL
jgi:hypothetical protein